MNCDLQPCLCLLMEWVLNNSVISLRDEEITPGSRLLITLPGKGHNPNGLGHMTGTLRFHKFSGLH